MSLNFVTQSKARSGPGLTIALGGVIIVGVLASAYPIVRRLSGGSSSGQNSGPIDRLYTVRAQPLDVTVKVRGELQAVENIELISRVEGRTTITDIVKEGSYVKKDDVLVQLDSAAIRVQIDDITLEVQRADAALANAREMLAIQESNNAAEVEGAQVALQLAEVELRKYVEGLYPQQDKTAATALDMAKIDMQNKLDDLSQAKSLFTRGFVTAADVKKAELAVTQAKNAVDEAETALRVLRDYSHQADLAAKQNAVAQAKSKLERVRRQNESLMVQKQADLNAADQQLQMRQRKLEQLNEQLAACTMRAPTDGMVVYSNSQDNQAVVQEGGEVRERQPILRLPDTRSMKVVLKLNEAQANRVLPGMRAIVEITGVPQPIAGSVGKVSIVPVSGNRWSNPDSKEYPTEILLDETPPNLKPATSAETTITIRSIDDALAVPLESLYSVGTKTFVFVNAGGQVTPREVRIGDASTTQVQIRSGVEAGEQVLVLEAGQGKALLEQAGIKIAPATQPSNRGPGAGNRNGGGGGGGGGGGAGNPGGGMGGAGPGAGGPGGANGVPASDVVAPPGGAIAPGGGGGGGGGGERRRRREAGEGQSSAAPDASPSRSRETPATMPTR